MAEERGKLIVVEGGDGSGKSSVAEALSVSLRAPMIHFPDDSAITGPMIRDYLKKKWWLNTEEAMAGKDHAVADRKSALAFQALQITNRMERMGDIEMLLSEGRHVVLVRYWQSAWVYGQLDGLDPDWLRSVHEMMIKPDLNIMLEVTSEVAMARRAARDGDLPPERYEGKEAFTKRVLDLYEQLWSAEEDRRVSHWGDWLRVDATASLPHVIGDTMSEVARWLHWGNLGTV